MTGGSAAPAASRAMANWLENMDSASSVRTPSLARKMFWNELYETLAFSTISARVVLL